MPAGLTEPLIFLGSVIAVPPFSRQKATSGCDSKMRVRKSGRAINKASISRILANIPKAWMETPRGGSDVVIATSLARRCASYQASMVVKSFMSA